MTDRPEFDARRSRQARIAVAVVFFVNGAVFANWVQRIPAVQDQVHAGTGPLGLALLGLAVGASLSKPVAGQLVARYGSGPVARLGITLTCLALLLPALATNVVTLGLALVGFGAALGIVDVGMNAHGVAVQGRLGRSVMSSLHGMFSVGGLVGSLASAGAEAQDWSPLVHFALAAAVLGAVALVPSVRLLPASCDVTQKTSDGGWARLPAGYRIPLVLLGVVGFCGMMAEGAVGDWSAIYLRGNLGAGAAFAAFGYSAYSIAMAVGRLLGDRCLARWGAVRVVTTAMAFAGCAFAVGLLAGQPVAALGGFTVLGLGLSVVMPAILSMAGRLGGPSTGPAITVVSGIAGTGMLAGPPLIGFLAQLTGLPVALGAISVLTLGAALLLRFVTSGHRVTTEPSPGARSVDRSPKGKPVTQLRPTDPEVLATAVVDSIVVARDPEARRSSLLYWEWACPWTQAVVTAVENAENPEIRALGGRLVHEPTVPDHYHRLRAALIDQAALPSTAPLFDAAWEAECNSRIAFHLGGQPIGDAEPVSAEDLRALPPGPALPRGAEPDVLVVVPFRDRDTGGARLRNLLACLLALRDQSFPRDRYHVTVVESDDHPRHRDAIVPFADHYVFAPKTGLFNKSWTVNAGVTHTSGRNELLCILDADVLADRDFIARNAERFRSPGVGGHLPYRKMSILDDSTTAWAIRDRIHGHDAEADPEHLRAFQLRRPPGCCLWVRTAIFCRIGGMDERYEGWGYEDTDFVYRYDTAAPFFNHDDWLLHMRHPPAPLITDEDGEPVNAGIPAGTWRPVEPIGQLDRFAES